MNNKQRDQKSYVPDAPYQMTELQNTAKITDQAKDADVLITQSGESISDLVNPEDF